VLIPCALGEKRPAFEYKDGLWSWDNFDELVMREPGAPQEPVQGTKDLSQVDWAIVLRVARPLRHRLRHTPEVAAQLEERFPLLRGVPCEKTARGYHYFFRRSALANSGGYYDGCAQVLKDCDFKSVTRTGTGGIIVVAPSTDKDWVRAPWDVALTEISDALLKAVARPAEAYSSGAAAEELSEPAGSCAGEPSGTACAPATVAAPAGVDADADAVRLSFEGDDDGDLVVSGARAGLVRKMDYVSALLSGRWHVESTNNDMPTLHVPCQRAVFEEILCLLEKGELSNERPPTVELLHAIEQTADMLGAPKRTQHPLLERATFWADLYQVCPDWWLESSEEQARMLGCSGADSDAALERITDELAQCLGYDPVHPKNSLWLFQELPHLLDPDRDIDLKVLMDHPSETLRAQLPEAVVSLLRLLPTCLAVAGGAVLGSVSRWAEYGSDVDLFLYGLDHDASADALRQIDAHIAENYEGEYERTSSVAAVTFTKKKHDATSSIDEKQRNRPFQIILGLHRSRSQILEYFDLAPCKSLARHDPESEELIVEALPLFINSLRRMAFHVDIMYWSPASVARIMKYVAKGFECLVPGIRRSAFKTETAKRGLAWYRYGHDKGGIRELFDAEADVINSRAYWSQPNEVLKREGEMVFGDELVIEKITGRLKLVEAATIASKVLHGKNACHTWTLEHTTYQSEHTTYQSPCTHY